MSPLKARSRFVQAGSCQAGLARFHMNAILKIYRNYIWGEIPLKAGQPGKAGKPGSYEQPLRTRLHGAGLTWSRNSVILYIINLRAKLALFNLISRPWGFGTVWTGSDIRDLKIAVNGKRLASRNSFVIKSKSWTVKYSSNTIYYKNLKCCNDHRNVIMQWWETVWGIRCLTFELTYDVCRPAVTLSGSLRQTTSNGTSQTSSYLSTKTFNINRQVPVVKQGVSIRSFRNFVFRKRSFRNSFQN